MIELKNSWFDRSPLQKNKCLWKKRADNRYLVNNSLPPSSIHMWEQQLYGVATIPPIPSSCLWNTSSESRASLQKRPENIGGLLISAAAYRCQAENRCPKYLVSFATSHLCHTQVILNVTHGNVLWHDYEWAMSHVWRYIVPIQIWIRQVAHASKTYVSVMSHMWMSRLYTFECRGRDVITNETCLMRCSHTYEWDMSDVRKTLSSRRKYDRAACHTCVTAPHCNTLQHAALNCNTLQHTAPTTMTCGQHNKYDRVLSHMCHARVNEWFHLHEYVLPHIQMNFVKREKPCHPDPRLLRSVVSAAWCVCVRVCVCMRVCACACVCVWIVGNGKNEPWQTNATFFWRKWIAFQHNCVCVCICKYTCINCYKYKYICI